MKKDILNTIIDTYEENIELHDSKPNKNGKVQKLRRAKKGYSTYKKELDDMLKEWMKEIEEKYPIIKYDMQIGMPYNLNQSPWIQFYYTEKNSKGRTGHYCGISFDNEKRELGVWIGFGMTGKSPIQISNELMEYRQEYKKIIGNELEKNFEYNEIYVDAVIIAKAIPYDKVISEKVKEDLEYLLKYYIKYVDTENKPNIEINDNNTDYKIFAKSSHVMGKNIIYKGFPGSGKSTKVKQTYLYENGKRIDEKRYEIVVFHREYTNSDFIGMLKPVEKNMNLVYEFEPGPFTRILKKAIKNEGTNFYLIIEE